MGRAGKKGFTQGELNAYMRRFGLYEKWIEGGMSNFEAVRLLCGTEKLPPNTSRRHVNQFLACLINGRMSRSMRREKRKKEALRALM